MFDGILTAPTNGWPRLGSLFGGKDGTRFDGADENGDGEPDTPQLTSDGVDAGDRDFSLPFPYLEDPKQE